MDCMRFEVQCVRGVIVIETLLSSFFPWFLTDFVDDVPNLPVLVLEEQLGVATESTQSHARSSTRTKLLWRI